MRIYLSMSRWDIHIYYNSIFDESVRLKPLKPRNVRAEMEVVGRSKARGLDGFRLTSYSLILGLSIIIAKPPRLVHYCFNSVGLFDYTVKKFDITRMT